MQDGFERVELLINGVLVIPRNRSASCWARSTSSTCSTASSTPAISSSGALPLADPRNAYDLAIKLNQIETHRDPEARDASPGRGAVLRAYDDNPRRLRNRSRSGSRIVSPIAR